MLIQEIYGYMEVHELTGIGWTALFLYFAIRPCRYIVLRFLSADPVHRTKAILAALAILHLSAFALFFALPIAVEGVRNLFSELFEVDFWLFPAIFVLLWALTSILVVLRHRNIELRLFSLGICAVLLVIAIVAMRMAPEAQSLFSAFGADLPSPTLLFVQDTWAFFLLPVAAAVAAGVLFAVTDEAGRVARYASAGVIALAVSANLALFGGLGSLYLPLFGCGSFVDTGYTRLHAAAVLGRDASALRQIAGGAPVNARDVNGATPLHLAVSNGNLVLADALLASGADASAVTASGSTPMHDAALSGRTDIAERLFARGARVDASTRGGGQPLHLTASRGHLAMAVLLLERGADVNATDNWGNTPLDRAYENKHARLASLLEERGGIRSTKESRQLVVERAKAQVQAAAPQAIRFGSCGAV